MLSGFDRYASLPFLACVLFLLIATWAEERLGNGPYVPVSGRWKEGAGVSGEIGCVGGALALSWDGRSEVPALGAWVERRNQLPGKERVTRSSSVGLE